MDVIAGLVGIFLLLCLLDTSCPSCCLCLRRQWAPLDETGICTACWVGIRRRADRMVNEAADPQ